MSRRSQLSELNERQSLIWIIIAVSILLSLLILVSSKFYLDNNPINEEQVPSITIESENFPTIQLGHYTLWGKRDDGTILFIKRFNSINNRLVNLDETELKSLTLKDLDEIISTFVTIENEGDRDETPNELILMETEITNNEANMKFHIDFPSEGNFFILATPTDGNSTINELSGIWFTDETRTNPGLTFQTPPKYFKYETRIINNFENKTLKIGRFDNVLEEDNSKIYSLSSDGFKFPGEDLLRNIPLPLEAPINLANGNYEVIVSLEPDINGVDITGDEVFLPLVNKTIALNTPAEEIVTLDSIYEPIQMKIKFNE